VFRGVENGRVKVFMGITLSEMGGAQKVVYDLISSLPEDRYDITLATCPGGELIQWIRNLELKKGRYIGIIGIPQLRRELSPFYDIWVFFKLYRLMRKERYDIAHFHSSKMGILERLAAFMAGVPKIYFTVHGWGINEYQPEWLQKMLGFAEKVAGRTCTMCLCVSRYHMYKGISRGWLQPGKARVIYNGIDPAPVIQGKLRRELNIQEDMAIIGSVMRLREPKQPVYTIQVFNEILKRGYRAKLIIMGDGPMNESCRQIIRQLGLKNDVYMLGTRADARELMNDMDIVTLFSKWEGLPIALIEAMFAGKPVVGSLVGGIPEVIDHGINGFMTNGFNASRDADYICLLLKDRALRANMGEAGKRKAVECFSKDRMVAAYDRLYRDC